LLKAKGFLRGAQRVTPQQTGLVQDSFKSVVPIAATAAELFYGRLFEIAPGVRPLFEGVDMKDQGRKLMTTLGVVVSGLTNLDAIVPVAKTLAIKHVDYGVKAEHYTVVGQALVWTLEKGLGNAFTNDVRSAWIEAYNLLSGVMTEAAYGKSININT
jgi:hemoglobin-like flavoprotein